MTTDQTPAGPAEHRHNDDPETIWVRSDVMPDGSYRVAFSIGEDLAWTLRAQQAIRYALACFDVATTAEHDAAVHALLTDGVGIPAMDASMVLHKDIRVPRRSTWNSPGPLSFTTGLTLEGKPFIHTIIDGAQTGQLSPAELRDHAAGVLRVVGAVNLDKQLHRALTNTMGIDDGRARAFVAILEEHWPPEAWPDEQQEANR